MLLSISFLTSSCLPIIKSSPTDNPTIQSPFTETPVLTDTQVPTTTTTPTQTSTQTPSLTPTTTQTLKPTYTSTPSEPSPTPNSGEVRNASTDGLEMVYIGEVEFNFGPVTYMVNEPHPKYENYYIPVDTVYLPAVHRIYLNPYWIDKYEVSAGAYKRLSLIHI